MKVYLLIFLISMSRLSLLGQSKDTWTLFWNEDSTLIGYKDKNGVVKIEPKFTTFTCARKFDHIIAVSEECDGRWYSYYLTKSGKLIGRDSLYIFDNAADCENEGFIRFRDRGTDRVGLLDRTGRRVIPAEYNDLTRVSNGMLIGLKGAVKKYADSKKHSGCDHFSWTGGEEVLIDTANRLLAADFKYAHPLNLFTLEKTKAPHPDTTRVSFLATDGSYYSFVEFEKEFKQWIKNELMNGLSLERLIAISFDSIVWESQDDWRKGSKEKVVHENFKILKNGLSEMLKAETDCFISMDGLNPFLYTGAAFENYFNHCGEPKDWKYPTMSIIVSHHGKNDFTQNHYEFLRTDEGYKLIGLAIKNENMK